MGVSTDANKIRMTERQISVFLSQVVQVEQCVLFAKTATNQYFHYRIICRLFIF